MLDESWPKCRRNSVPSPIRLRGSIWLSCVQTNPFDFALVPEWPISREEILLGPFRSNCSVEFLRGQAPLKNFCSRTAPFETFLHEYSPVISVDYIRSSISMCALWQYRGNYYRSNIFSTELFV